MSKAKGRKSPHIRKVERLHGEGCFKKWGKLGGNPDLNRRSKK